MRGAALLLTSLFAGASGWVRPLELNALWALYESTDGANWTNSLNWRKDNDPCRRSSSPAMYRKEDEAPTPFKEGEVVTAQEWFGVGCIDPCDDYLDGPGCTAGRINSVYLRNNNLRGELSGWDGLGEMRNLSHLDLSHNFINGTIPTVIGHLNNVEELILENNALSGEIPTELGAVNANQAEELQELSLSHNSLTGALPTQLGELSALELLDLGHNQLAGTVPTQYGGFHELQVLTSPCSNLSPSPNSNPLPWPGPWPQPWPYPPPNPAGCR